MISNSFAGLMVIAVSAPITDEPRNRMTELVTYGSVGGAAGNSRSYPELVIGPGYETWLRQNPHRPSTRVSALFGYRANILARIEYLSEVGCYLASACESRCVSSLDFATDAHYNAHIGLIGIKS